MRSPSRYLRTSHILRRIVAHRPWVTAIRTNLFPSSAILNRMESRLAQNPCSLGNLDFARQNRIDGAWRSGVPKDPKGKVFILWKDALPTQRRRDRDIVFCSETLEFGMGYSRT